jgi:mbt repeat
MCVATIIELNPNEQRLCVHFDGWTDKYDYWCPYDSANIAPIGTCAALGHNLQPPKGYGGVFDWAKYLTANGATAVAKEAFLHGCSIGPATKVNCTSPTNQF